MQLLALILVAWTHVGWHAFLRVAVPAGWGRARGAVPRAPGHANASRAPGAPSSARAPSAPSPERTSVTVVVAAYAEEAVIARTVRALLAQDRPAEVIVACDGSPDATAARAREAGAHHVIELPRGGKHAAQAAAVARASGSVLAFCDANTTWEPDALSALLGAFHDPAVGYACGHVAFVRGTAGVGSDAAAPSLGAEMAARGLSHGPAAPSSSADSAAANVAPSANQEGAYWALELATRRLESEWHSVTAGNGAIYALRADLWPHLRTDLGHDLALPHQVVRRGLLAVDVPEARAQELMVPSLEGEWRRKRRMMARMWGIVARDPSAGGLLDPRGLPPRYLLALVSHRWLRYASPALHVVAVAAGLRGAATGRAGGLERTMLAAQLALLAGATAPSLAGCGSKEEPDPASVWRWLRVRPFLLCRYYVLMTASIAAGGLDRVREGAPTAGWAPAEGTR